MNHYSHISNLFWPIVTKFCTVKLLWIFLFIVVTITVSLMVMYQGQKNELKRYILGTKSAHDISINKVHKNFEVLSEDLSEKKDTINKSRNEIKCAEEILDFIESKKITSVACYKNLLGDLKKDLLKIESEVKELQNEIKELSKRRDDLKHDILQQQEKPYICTKELDFNVISNQNSFDDYKLKIN